jgi:hypothetical protein
LAKEIDKKLVDYVKQASRHSGHEKSLQEQELIQIIRRSVAAYLSDTTHEPDWQPPYTSRYSPEALSGAGLMECLGELFAGFADAFFRQTSEVQPEEHRPDLNRKSHQTKL